MDVNLTQNPYVPEVRGLHEDLEFNTARERQRLEVHLRMQGLTEEQVRVIMEFVDRLVGRAEEETEWAN